ncbi:MAG: MarR family transcriptional regulator [Candidatus Omnitrophica bacterium]|nr:MarR family transcriptional regulator [Candidatus Omnitrophota bacterium]
MADKAALKNFVTRVMEVLPQVIRGFLRTQGNALSRGQISPAQYFALDAVDRQEALKMGELAAELSVSLPAMSGLVERLCKIKLVKRVYPEKDRRVIKIAISPRGKNILERIRVQREIGFEKIFSQLPQKDRMDYLRIIIKVRDILNKDIKDQG